MPTSWQDKTDAIEKRIQKIKEMNLKESKKYHDSIPEHSVYEFWRQLTEDEISKRVIQRMS